jgi:aminopeptidase N
MPSLTRDEAIARATLLTTHSYAIELDLSDAPTGTPFLSTTRVRFTCREPGADTFIEINPDELLEIALNGATLDPLGLAENRFPLAGLAAQNELVVRARMTYSRAAQGMHRFVDPSDDAVYLYAQSFLDDAQRMFACFDQPDLKASLRVTVIAPATWQVAANAAQVEPASPPPATEATRRWEFAPTAPIPPYLFSMIAGEYHVRRTTHDGIAMAIYCRRSLAPHLDVDLGELFEVTRVCLDRFHELFGVRYPFGKYDQVFVPEFNAGAMENPGLVTIRDEYVFRSAVTDNEREQRVRGIAHEMAHMWFGNLVTMRWWDDLWLNESFAEYMGHRVPVEVTRFSRGWTEFVVARKGWGYAADQRGTTHPVAPTALPDAGQAFLNFDGISYAKGAAVLRQLAVWIGDDAFLSGLRTYFADHAFGNATLDDLLGALAAASGRDLADWARRWLRTAQVNTLRPQVVVGADGRYQDVTVVQTAPPAYPTLRPHRIGVGVYRDGTATRQVQVDLDPAVDGGRTRLAELVGEPAGDLLLLNDGDLTYAKIRFDPASRAALPRVLPGLADSLARALVWAAMVDAVRDAEVSVDEFVALVASALPDERELSLVRDVTAFVNSTAVPCYLPAERQPVACRVLADAFRAAMLTAEPGGDRQLVTARAYLRVADEGADLDAVRGWLDAVGVPDGLQIDADLRWQVLYRLAVLGRATADEIDEEFDRDHTATGAENAARARAARPDPAAKAAAWQIMFDDRSQSNRAVVATAAGFWQASQADLTTPYVQRYFAELPRLAAGRLAWLSSTLARDCFPRFAVDPTTVALAEAALAGGLDPTLAHAVTECTDDLRRALTARQASERLEWHALGAA